MGWWGGLSGATRFALGDAVGGSRFDFLLRSRRKVEIFFDNLALV